jgi:hypothetical protein
MKTKKVNNLFHTILFILWLSGFFIAGMLAVWTEHQDLAGKIAYTSFAVLILQVIIGIVTTFK